MLTQPTCFSILNWHQKWWSCVNTDLLASFSWNTANHFTSPPTLWDAAVDTNLIVNSCHCVTLWLHNRHLTRNVPWLSDQKGNRSKQLALAVSAQRLLYGVAALGCCLIPPDKCDLSSVALCVEEWSRLSFFCLWLSGTECACRRGFFFATRRPASGQDLRSQPASHILINSIIRSTSSC